MSWHEDYTGCCHNDGIAVAVPDTAAAADDDDGGDDDGDDDD